MIKKYAVIVLDAGGTISATSGAAGVSAGPSGALQQMWSGDTAPRFRPVYSGLSEDMTLADAMNVAAAAISEAEAGNAVVVAHGTDTLEETAFLTSLFYEGERPIVFTGAMRTPDARDYDGRRNLSDAIGVARSTAAAGRGVMISFSGAVYRATARKRSTTELAAFGGEPPIGCVKAHTAVFERAAPPLPRALPAPARIGGVEIITLPVGDDGEAIDRATAAGARGLVILTMGRGNAPASVAAAIRRARSAGVIAAIVSRCESGAVAPDYAAGRRIADAGGVFCAALTAPQARLLLAALIAIYESPAQLAEALALEAARRS